MCFVVTSSVPTWVFLRARIIDYQKADDKNFVCKAYKILRKFKLYHIENSMTSGENSVGPDEVADYVQSHLDLCCLQSRLFSSLVLKELNM